MPIRNRISDIVALLPGQPIAFIYGTKDEINEKADRNVIWPAVFLYPLHPVGIEIGVNGSAHNDYELYMEFMTITKFEKDSSDNAELVEAMQTLANQFLILMNQYVKAGDQSRYFSLGKGFKARSVPIYWSKDVNLTGVSLSFKVDRRQDDPVLCI